MLSDAFTGWMITESPSFQFLIDPHGLGCDTNFQHEGLKQRLQVSKSSSINRRFARIDPEKNSHINFVKAAGILIRHHLSEYLLCGSLKLVFVIIDISQSTEIYPVESS